MFGSLFRRITGKDRVCSKEIAKNRLKLTLIYDKLEVTDDILNDLHRDIIEVISRYFEIDKEAFKLNIHRAEDLSSLVVNTPILAAKHRQKETHPLNAS